MEPDTCCAGLKTPLDLNLVPFILCMYVPIIVRVTAAFHHKRLRLIITLFGLKNMMKLQVGGSVSDCHSLVSKSAQPDCARALGAGSASLLA